MPSTYRYPLSNILGTPSYQSMAVVVVVHLPGRGTAGGCSAGLYAMLGCYASDARQVAVRSRDCFVAPLLAMSQDSRDKYEHQSPCGFSAPLPPLSRVWPASAATMKSSRSPSSTAWVFEVSTPVRRSLIIW